MNKYSQHIKLIDINLLVEAEYNPRQITKEQHAQITDSIEKFGFVDPIIVNINKSRKNVIIGGHQRVKVAKELKYKKLPCIELDLDLTKERELNVRLNKNVGQWDYDILANTYDLDELLNWGFKEYELKIDFPEKLDKMAEWEGMPEFDNEDLTPYKQIRVSFRNDEDIKAFSKLIKQKITEKTKSVWHPKMEINPVKHKKYSDSES